MMAGAFSLLSLANPYTAQAQNAPDKIRLMSDALRARDAGDFKLAQVTAEKLLKLAPQDTSVQSLLVSINEELARLEVKPVTTVVAPLPVAAEAEVTEPLIPQPKSATQLTLEQANSLIEAGHLAEAELVLEAYFAADGDSKDIYKLSRQLQQRLSDPYALDIADISPQFVAQNKIIRDLTARGRAQFLNGDYAGASATFMEIEARDTNNAEAKQFQALIAELISSVQRHNNYKTRSQMLTEVDQNWERPKVFEVDAGVTSLVETDNSIQRKMYSIVIPQVNFSGMELTRVIESLSELSAEYDADGVGVNIVPLFSSDQNNPQVNISLRNLSLDRILQFVTQQVSFSYDVGSDAVTVSPSDSTGGVSTTVTEFFPISRATVIRLTGVSGSGGSADSDAGFDPFAAPVAGSSAGGTGNDEIEALQGFFQRAGVNFELVGASLAFDGEQLIATQTRRNLERMRTILRNYNEVKQVEIEAKFLEVAQGDLDELGFNWSVSQPGNSDVFSTQGRNLSNAFAGNSADSNVTINVTKTFETKPTETIPQIIAMSPPIISGIIDTATNATSTFVNGLGIAGAYDLDLKIRALERKTGSDLMNAPKVTVLSGKRALIKVAQEMRYPESYGDIEATVSQASSSGSSDSSSSAIAITAGTPQDFVTRNVGVELAVTPNVENDDTISLILEPKVTEFDGFVEYGGTSVAVSGETTVTVPSGFYQPIFSVREIETEVTVYDGATVVMGGLTRDEVKIVRDSVPFLGNIPGLGRLFRSEGETRQKRNLLIFVTANLVSPGGSPARQNYRNVNANSMFQNPTLLTPSGSVSRQINDN